jgi:acetyl-CoA carboxylase biotin carboxylase subunit
MITGVDLVKQQIRIAEGEAIGYETIPRSGAAMECRIYAEDPANNFLPSPGLIKALTDPGGPGVRNDSGVYPGYIIPMEYDPMISKLVTWGETRQQAIDRMLRALEEYYLLGIRTNISYLRKIISHPNFAAGDYDTHFIPTHQEQLLETETEHYESIALAAAVILNFMRGEQQSAARKNESVGAESAWKIAGRKRSMGL